MKLKHRFLNATLLSLAFLPAIANAQGTLADYERANNLRKTFQDAAVNIPDRANWIEKTSRLWYRRSAKGGNEVVLVDAEEKKKKLVLNKKKFATPLSPPREQMSPAAPFPATALPFGG